MFPEASKNCKNLNILKCLQIHTCVNFEDKYVVIGAVHPVANEVIVTYVISNLLNKYINYGPLANWVRLPQRTLSIICIFFSHIH